MERIQFNTGRKYTTKGQWIVAILHEDGVVTFMDHSRLIGGEFDLNQAQFNMETVMRVYDAGRYYMSVRALHGHGLR